MGFPSLESKTTLDRLFRDAQAAAGDAKRLAISAAENLQDGGAPSRVILNIASRMAGFRSIMDEARTAPGMGQWVKDEIDDQSIDIIADFNTMFAALDDVIAWIVTNFPNDGTYILARSLLPTGQLSERQFTSGQTAGLQSALTALAATID